MNTWPPSIYTRLIMCTDGRSSGVVVGGKTNSVDVLQTAGGLGHQWQGKTTNLLDTCGWWGGGGREVDIRQLPFWCFGHNYMCSMYLAVCLCVIAYVLPAPIFPIPILMSLLSCMLFPILLLLYISCHISLESTMTAESFGFQAEISQLLDLIIGMYLFTFPLTWTLSNMHSI